MVITYACVQLTHRHLVSGSPYGVQSEYLSGCVSRVFVDQTEYLEYVAIASILKTTIIMLVLIRFTYLFNHDADELIITPVKRMTKYVSVSCSHIANCMS